MRQYLDMIHHVVCNGNSRGDRTGTGTQSVFGYQTRFDLQQGFPLLTTKKMFLKGIIHELLWMLAGDTNIKYLTDNGVHIWDEWADEHGDLGPVYGHQWRSWPGHSYAASEPVNSRDRVTLTGDDLGGSPYNFYDETIDQIANVIARIKSNPEDRRLIVSAWNPADIEDMKLPPCHCFFQFYTRELSLQDRAAAIGHLYVPDSPMSAVEYHQWLDGNDAPRRALDCQLYQRSADLFLGVPFNIASYSLLTMMIAQVCDMAPGEFVHTFGDLHIYDNHRGQIQNQYVRNPFPLPKMVLDPKVRNIQDFKYESFTLEGYQCHPAISAPVAV